MMLVRWWSSKKDLWFVGRLLQGVMINQADQLFPSSFTSANQRKQNGNLYDTLKLYSLCDFWIRVESLCQTKDNYASEKNFHKYWTRELQKRKKSNKVSF